MFKLHSEQGSNLHMLGKNIQADEVGYRVNLLTWSLHLKDDRLLFIATAVTLNTAQQIPKGFWCLLPVSISLYVSALPY